MQNGPEIFFLTNERSIDKFLGIEIKRLSPQEFEISQPFLIDQIVTFLSLKSEEYEIHCNDKFTPAVMQVLNKDLNGEANEDIVEVSDSCRHDVLFTWSHPARHLDASSSNCLFLEWSKISSWTRVYSNWRIFAGNNEEGIRYKIDKSKRLECYVVANFAGGWDITDPYNVSNLMSRTGFVLKYADCPIFGRASFRQRLL
jgi:hypothetical protein